VLFDTELAVFTDEQLYQMIQRCREVNPNLKRYVCREIADRLFESRCWCVDRLPQDDEGWFGEEGDDKPRSTLYWPLDTEPQPATPGTSDPKRDSPEPSTPRITPVPEDIGPNCLKNLTFTETTMSGEATYDTSAPGIIELTITEHDLTVKNSGDVYVGVKDTPKDPGTSQDTCGDVGEGMSAQADKE
jgi:hypothetical protein